MERFFSYTSNSPRRDEEACITLLSGPSGWYAPRTPHLALLKLALPLRTRCAGIERQQATLAPLASQRSAFLLVQGQREDLAPLPVRGEQRGAERPRRGVHLQQGEAGEQPPFPVPGEEPSFARQSCLYGEKGSLLLRLHCSSLLKPHLRLWFQGVDPPMSLLQRIQIK